MFVSKNIMIVGSSMTQRAYSIEHLGFGCTRSDPERAHPQIPYPQSLSIAGVLGARAWSPFARKIARYVLGQQSIGTERLARRFVVLAECLGRFRAVGD